MRIGGRLPVPAAPRCMAVAILLGGLVFLSGCTVRSIAVNALGNALARGGATYARDDDPELVAAAVPFGLKTMEALIEEAPRHRGLLLAAATGFTQYAWAFVQSESDEIEAADLPRATALRARAGRLYIRARDYGLRCIEVGHPGFREALAANGAGALARMTRADVPALYWTGASWAAAISLAKEDSEMTGDLPLVEALMRRALDLEESFGEGAIHEFFVAYEGGRPSSAGGSVERARAHLARARSLSKGRRVAPLVAFAETVCVSEQNRAEFERLLAEALAVDPNRYPDRRLENLLAQKRARWLLTRSSELFLEQTPE